MKKLSILSLLAGSALLCAVPVSLQLSQDKLSVSLDRASAAVGDPLTPGSVLGVHRRVERRAERRAYRFERRAARHAYYDAGAVGAAGASTAHPGYGAFAAGVYSVANDSIDYYSTSAVHYPTRAIYAHGFVPGSYYGPVCNPRFDLGCQ